MNCQLKCTGRRFLASIDELVKLMAMVDHVGP